MNVLQNGKVVSLSKADFRRFMAEQMEMVERLVYAPERSNAPEGYDEPAIDLEAEGRTTEATMASQAAGEVVQHWRDAGWSWRSIALMAFHRWPHMRTPAWTAMPSNQLIGSDLCSHFGVVEKIDID